MEHSRTTEYGWLSHKREWSTESDDYMGGVFWNYEVQRVMPAMKEGHIL